MSRGQGDAGHGPYPGRLAYLRRFDSVGLGDTHPRGGFALDPVWVLSMLVTQHLRAQTSACRQTGRSPRLAGETGVLSGAVPFFPQGRDQGTGLARWRTAWTKYAPTLRKPWAKPELTASTRMALLT